MNKKTIYLCIPKGRKFSDAFSVSLIGLLLNSQYQNDYHITLLIREQPFRTGEFDDEKYKYIAEARQKLADVAIEENADYIFFVDDDTLLPSDALDRLFKHNLDFVSGLNFMKKPPYYPTLFDSVYTRTDKEIRQTYKHRLDYPEGLIEVEAVGLFCALIKVEALKKLRKPFFSSPELSMTSHIGEDVSFCRRMWESGFKLFVDTTIKCGHIDDTKGIIITEQDFIKFNNIKEDKYVII